MFHEHGLNIGPASIIKKYTSLPVGAVGGINSPEQVDQAIADARLILRFSDVRCWQTRILHRNA